MAASSDPSADVTDRCVDELDRVQRRQRCLRTGERVRDLDEAAGVRARIRLGAGREDVRGLAVAQLARGLRLRDVVDPGRPAAEILLGGLDDLEAGDPAERRARGEREALGVPEVAGVLQRHLHRQRMPGRAGRRLAEKLPDVAHPRGKCLGTLVAEEPAELFQVRAAARGVDDDEIDVVERVDEPPREGLPFVESPGMNRERAAAALRRSHDLEAVRGENACGRGIDVGEDRALHAAGQEANARSRRAARGCQGGYVTASPPARRDVHERAEALRHRRGAAEGSEP